jgi:hypothetical protein
MLSITGPELRLFGPVRYFFFLAGRGASVVGSIEPLI